MNPNSSSQSSKSRSTTTTTTPSSSNLQKQKPAAYPGRSEGCLDNKFKDTWEGRLWLDWGGFDVDEDRLREISGFKFLSYHLLADRKATSLRYTSAKAWSIRKKTLLNEILSYDADIICLQDVDHYDDWWQPQFMLRGYDSLWKQRTCEEFDHSEGVCILYKRHLFQLFKTVSVDLNRSADTEDIRIRKRCLTDDVGLIAFLQPLPLNYLKSAVCIVTAMLTTVPADLETDVRAYQAKYLTKCIEIANRDFHIPVILGISLHDQPDSAAYHILRTGRTQIQPSIPPMCEMPIVEPFCRGSVKVYWKAPILSEADPTILCYHIAWRPGGNRSIGYRNVVKVSAGDCIQYASVVNEKGIRKTVALELRSTLITGLAADVPFEFKILAVNAIGEGPWSEPSLPAVLMNPLKAPRPKKLEILKDYAGTMEIRESEDMTKMDYNANKAVGSNLYDPQTGLTPRTIDGVPDNQITRSRMLPLSTNPRLGWKGKLKGEMDESLREILYNKTRMKKSTIMDESGYVQSVSASPDGKQIAYLDGQSKVSAGVEFDSTIASNNIGEDSLHSVSKSEVEIVKKISEEQKYEDDDFEDDDESFNYRVSEAKENLHMPLKKGQLHVEFSDDEEEEPVQELVSIVPPKHTLAESTEIPSNATSSWEATSPIALSLFDSVGGSGGAKFKLNIGGEIARKVNDDVILDCKAVVDTIGKANKRHVHALNFRSAYECYSIAGEPLYTVCNPDNSNYLGVSCMDYIFFTCSSILPSKILSLPILSRLEGDDPREAICSADPYFFNPPTPISKQFNNIVDVPGLSYSDNGGQVPKRAEIDKVKKLLNERLTEYDKNTRQIWGGQWLPFATPNARKQHSWLPNESFSSSHVALACNFQFNEKFMSSEWT